MTEEKRSQNLENLENLAKRKISKFSRLLEQLKKEKPKNCKVVVNKSLGGGNFNKLIDRL